MTITLIVCATLVGYVAIFRWGIKCGKRELLAEIEKYFEQEARKRQ